MEDPTKSETTVNGTHDSRTTHKQLIDDHKNYNRQAHQQIISLLGPDVGRNFYIVAIIGVQNSGKSTLLNHLFGTQFDVLQQMAGSRTTRGIWISLDKSENLLVLDVEGNDAMDRAEEQDYEKMVASYALSTANVLIINIWCKALGGYTGSQYETLKVIMQICISQFKHESPKTILFCVRDFNEEYDEQGEIRRKIQNDVKKLWRDIEKPLNIKPYADTPQKFFTIQVCCLRRYKQTNDKYFRKDVEKLRDRFINKKSDGYIFAKQKQEFNLPLSDLAELSENSWKSIVHDQKLNLPNEKEQLANFRCSSISSEIENDFENLMKQLQNQNKVGNYGQIRDSAIKKYEERTYHYGKNIANEKKQSLANYIDDHLKKVIVEKLRAFEDQVVKSFMNGVTKVSTDSKVSLEQQLKNLVQQQIQEYIKFMKSMNYEIPNRKETIDELSVKLNEKFIEIKKNLLEQMKDDFQKKSSRVLRLLGSEVIKDCFGFEFWEKSLIKFDDKDNELLDEYSERYCWVTGQSLSAIEYDNLEEANSEMFYEAVRTQLEKSLQGRVFQFFLETFRKEENSNNTISFNLKTEQQICTHFEMAREKANLLLKKMNELSLKTNKRASLIEMQASDEETFFPSTWFSTVADKLEKKMIDEFEKVIRRKKQSEMNNVPIWLFVVILYFLYDDVWFTAEENPIMHYTILAFVLLSLTLVAIGQGRILKETLKMIMEALKNKLPFLR